MASIENLKARKGVKMSLTERQQQVVEHSQGDLLVSASAGSGKTMVVIQRILRLITEKNVSIDNILAVTFTNAAAS